MLNNIMGAMTEITAQASSAISAPIVFEHRANNTTTQTTNTFATTDATGNFKIDGDVITDGIKFILSKTVTLGEEKVFLKKEPVRNDTVQYDGKTWYVAEVQTSDVELILICVRQFYTQKTHKVGFGGSRR